MKGAEIAGDETVVYRQLLQLSAPSGSFSNQPLLEQGETPSFHEDTIEMPTDPMHRQSSLQSRMTHSRSSTHCFKTWD